MRIAICDDCARECEELRKELLLTDIGSASSISIFHSGEALISAMTDGNFFDTVFLDIDMANLNGIETCKLMRKMKTDTIIIFLTSHPEYAIDAFDCEAFHYMLKPLSREKLIDVMERAVKRFGLLHRYQVVKTKNGSIRVSLSDIYYLESLDRHVIYHLKDEEIKTRAKLSDEFESLRNLGFCRVHQGFVVNMDKIKNIEKDSVILTDGRSVMMSVRKKAEVSLAYMKYVEKFSL